VLSDQLQDDGAVDDVTERSKADKGDAKGLFFHGDTITDASQKRT